MPKPQPPHEPFVYGWQRETPKPSKPKNRTNEHIRSTAEIRAMNLKRLYDITPEEFDAMRVAQGFRCAICNRHESDIPERKPHGRPRNDGQPTAAGPKLELDHCHEGCGNRKLLCRRCNLVLGMAQDDPAILRTAALYLEAVGCANHSQASV